MQIKKQDANVGKAIFSGEIKSEADGSIIVPDIKPDILKVLQVDAESVLEEKAVDNGKLILKGKVYVNVLYIPDTENGNVQCIKGVFDFCETVKKSEFQQGMDIVATCDINRVGYKLINSRKIGIEAHISLNVNITSENCVSFVCDVESDCAETKSDIVSMKDISVNKEFTFQVEEKIELPGSCNVEILKSTTAVIEKELRAITGKIIAKGKIKSSILYVTESGNYEHIDSEFPFTEVFDWEDAEEDIDYDVFFEILESEFKFNNNTENADNSITAYLKVKVIIQKESFKDVVCIKDCYFTNSDCEFKYITIPCEKVCLRPNISTIVKQVIEKNDDLPEISKIYTIQANPYITSTEIINNNIKVSGKIAVCVLYISDNDKIPLSGLSDEIPFTQTIECDNLSDEIEIDLYVETEHIGYTLNSENSIEVRCGILIKGNVIKKSEVKIISDITINALSNRDNAMIIYFVTEEDSLWNIGKEYHVKCDEILKCNNINEEDICVGKKIVIPVVK